MNLTQTPIVYQRIQKLSVQLANQIAAGEVVERPASVLKELLENSLDAGSQQIEVTLEQGGIGLIRVQDNGVGICKEDLELAVAAHATSKIQTLSDLEGVKSYGFRGEALASISAVSRLKLSSSTEEQSLGWCLEMMGRNTKPILSPIPKRQGTTVEVRDLFYNTPARRKFLRSEKTEQIQLEEIFIRIALSQPRVTFSLFQGDRLQKRLTAARTKDAEAKRVALLCGEKFMDNAYYIEAQANGLTLFGWVGSPQLQRSQADLQYFYVNGRMVRDKVVSHALRQAYQDFCLPGRFPAYLLYFELDPAAVDVNVHPTKHEVRFRETRAVHAFLTYSVKEGLTQAEKTIVPVPISLPVPASFSKTDETNIEKPVSLQTTLYQPDLIVEPKLSLGKPISILGDEFLLAESEEALVIVDIKASLKAVKVRQFEEAYLQGEVPTRPLLMPKSITLDLKTDKIDIESQLEALKKLGFEITQAGPNTILIRSVPALFGETVVCLEVLVRQLLSNSLAWKDKIEIMAKHLSETHRCSVQASEILLKELQQYEPSTEEEKRKLYRRITVEQLRTALF